VRASKRIEQEIRKGRKDLEVNAFGDTRGCIREASNGHNK
jgi:hypothetical protein